MTPEQRMELIGTVVNMPNNARVSYMGRIIEFVEKLELMAHFQGQQIARTCCACDGRHSLCDDHAG